MLSQHWIKQPAAAFAASLLLLGGCAGVPFMPGGSSQSSGNETEAGSGSPERAPAPVATPASNAPAAARTLYEQATSSMAAGDAVDAELRLKEFVLQYPEYPGAWVNLAIIHTENGDLEAARNAVDSALGLNPDHPAALNQLGVLHRKKGNFRDAESAYLKAVTVSPGYALAHYNLGVLNELYLQRLEAALRHFEAYRALVAEDKQVDKWIADLRRRTGADSQAAN